MDYYSDIINQNCHKPKALFSIIDSVLNPHEKGQMVSSFTPEMLIRDLRLSKLTLTLPNLFPALSPGVVLNPSNCLPYKKSLLN